MPPAPTVSSLREFDAPPAQVVSASLDQTVRVWDISGLRKKTVSPGGDDVLRLPQVPSRRFHPLGSPHFSFESLVSTAVQQHAASLMALSAMVKLRGLAWWARNAGLGR